MNGTRESPALRGTPRARVLDAIRDYWWLVLLMTVVAVVVAALLSFSASKRYEAGTDVLVTPVSNSDPTFVGMHVLREGNVGSRSVLTVARLVQSPRVAAGVEERLGIDRNELLESIEVIPQQQSDIVTITGKAANPAGAAAIANGFAQVLLAQQTADFDKELRATIGRLRELLGAFPPERRESPETTTIRGRLAQLSALLGTQNPSLQIVSEAVPPEQAVWPKPALSIGLSFIAGLLLGIGAAVALRSSRPRVASEHDLPPGVARLVLAHIPFVRNGVLSRVMRREPRPADLTRAYATLRAGVANMAGAMPSSLLVTSTTDGEGKTMTVANLAMTMAVGGAHVVVVDGDPHGVTASSRLGVSPNGGRLSLSSAAGSDAMPAPRYDQRLRVLKHDWESLQVLDKNEVVNLLVQLRGDSDVLILDCPPAAGLTGALVEAVDVILIAVRAGRTRPDRLEELVKALADSGMRNVGIVLSGGGRSGGSSFDLGRSLRSREHNVPGRRHSPVSDEAELPPIALTEEIAAGASRPRR